MRRRAGFIVTGGIAALVVFLATAAPASAHFCYKNHLTPRAAAGMANSQGFATFGEVAFEQTGLCPAGVQVLADAAGVTTATPINLHATMAGGTSGNPAISHLDFAAIDAAFPDAVDACT
ncbi:MAG: hypothetical protein ACRDQD_26545 [Nocardioidaceae bacterium]